MNDEMRILIALAEHLGVTIMVSGGDIEGSTELHADLFMRDCEGAKQGTYVYTIDDD